MPKGIYTRKASRCKQPGCEGSKFTTISKLRAHQWRYHPQMFDKLRASTSVGRPVGRPSNKRKSMAGLIKGTPEYRAADSYNKRLRRVQRLEAEGLSETKALSVLPPTPVNFTTKKGEVRLIRNGMSAPQLPSGMNDMRLSDLLAEVKKDHKFLAAVIDYISGIAARHPEAQ